MNLHLPRVQAVILQYKHYLETGGYSIPTVKNYITDLRHLIEWAFSQNPEFEFFSIDKQFVRTYRFYLYEQGEKPAVVLRRLSSLNKFLDWLYHTGLITGHILAESKEALRAPLDSQKEAESRSQFESRQSNKPSFANPKEVLKTPAFTPSKESLSTAEFDFSKLPFHQKIIHHARFTRPAWYKKYHANDLSTITHYILVILILVSTAILLFYNFVFTPEINKTKFDLTNQIGSVLPATAPPRILSFQGRLTNTSDQPITSATNIIFRIYTSTSGDTGSPCAGTCLWESKTWSVTPDQNGIFSVLLGDTSQGDNAIPANLFTDNAALYLGVKVGTDSEMTPRQRIAASSYALNSDALDGIDSLSFLRSDTSDNFTSGTLTLDDGTTFTVNAATIAIGNATGDSITVNGKSTFNTDVDFSFGGAENLALISDGVGGSSDSFTLSISPSSSAGALRGIVITQSSSTNTFPLDSALTIDNADNDLTIGDAISITNTGGGGTPYTNLFNSPTLDITGAGAISGATGITSSGTITFSSLSGTANAVIYTAQATGTLTKVTETQTANLCLLSGAGVSGVPSWGSCPGGAFSGEVDDTTNDSLTFTSDDPAPPAGTVSSIFRDNSGDLNINTISGKTLNIQIAGTDEFNFSAAELAFNSNNITGLADITLTGNIVDSNSAVTINDDITVTGDILGSSSTSQLTIGTSAIDANSFAYITGANQRVRVGDPTKYGGQIIQTAYNDVDSSIDPIGGNAVGLRIQSRAADCGGVCVGIVNTFYGLNADVGNDRNFAFITTASAIRATGLSSATGVDTINLFHAANISGTTAPTNTRGLYIEALTLGSNRYGIYQAGNTATNSNYNILAANTKIGDTADPTAGIELDVAGDIQLSGNLTDGDSAVTINDSLLVNVIATIGNGSGNDYLEFAEEAANPTCSAGLYAIWANSTDAKLKKCQNGTITDLDTTGGGGSPTLDAITAAIGAGGVQDSNANSIFWNWDFTSAGVDSGLTISESSASTNGLQDQQSLLELITLSSSTASPLQVTAGGVDVGDIWFDLTGSSDFEIRDAGVPFVTFTDTGQIDLGKSSVASTINIGGGSGGNTINIAGSTATGTDTINIGTGGILNDIINIGNSTVGTSITISSGGSGIPAPIDINVNSMISNTAITIDMTSLTTGKGIQINTTALTTGNALEIVGPSSVNLLTVGRSTEGVLDFARVAIGSNQTRDQFSVAGRINSTWDWVFADFVGGSINIAADTNSHNMVFDEDAECNWVTLADNNHSTIRARAGATPTAGDGCNTSSGGVVGIRKNENPVMEVSLRASTDANTAFYKIGFTDDALGADSSTNPNNGIYFRKDTSTANWFCVNRASGIETAIDSGIAVSTTTLQKLRIEVENQTDDQVRYFIDDTPVCNSPITTNVPTATLGWTVSNGNPASATATTIDIFIDSIKVWHDDPPGKIGNSDSEVAFNGDFDPTNNSDVAEYYLGNAPPGTLVKLKSSTDAQTAEVEATNSAYDPLVLGVVSSIPKITLGETYDNLSTVEVGLVGRVPTRVTTNNGADPIKKGDYLTSSFTPGVAMKAKEAGWVVGIALDDFSGIGEGMILMFINRTWYQPPPDLSVNPDNLLTLDTENNIVATVSAGTKFVWKSTAGKIVAWISDSGEAVFQKVTALAGDFAKLVFGEAVVKKDSKIAGEITFEPGQTEIIIQSDKVKEDSLIYITATTKTGGVIPYIKEKRPGEGFVIGLEKSTGDKETDATASATKAIKFNWLIVNQE